MDFILQSIPFPNVPVARQHQSSARKPTLTAVENPALQIVTMIEEAHSLVGELELHLKV